MKSFLKSPSAWVPTLYFAEAVPYMAVMTLCVIMYTNFGLSNTELALYTSWLYLPWVIKPLWSPLVDSMRTKRWWIVAMQVLVGGTLAAVALTLHTSWWLKGSLCFFWLMAFGSATHDIAADGFYILGLNEKEQALFVGIRSTAYRVGMIFCQGLVVVLAGFLCEKYGMSLGWTITMLLLAVVMLLLAFWHTLCVPKVEYTNSRMEEKENGGILQGFWLTLRTFGQKPRLISAVLFMLLFRFPEAQLAKMAQPFMLRQVSEGGLELSTIDVGVAYGTIGVIGLLLGGIIGGVLVSRNGLKRWWWPMVLAISVPDVVYVFFALFQPTNIYLIYIGVALEQLGYGFGFTAYSLFLVYFSRGERSTSVFSLCTALQALGMMLPGMMAGWLADTLGFTLFFTFVVVCCLITFAVSAMVRLPEEGR